MLVWILNELLKIKMFNRFIGRGKNGRLLFRKFNDRLTRAEPKTRIRHTLTF